MPAERDIAIAIPALSAEIFFARMEGEDALSRPFAYSLLLSSRDMNLKAEAALGTGATITVAAPGGAGESGGSGESGSPRHFHGLIADFALEEIRDDLAFFRLTLRPWLWFLSLDTDNRIFQAKAVPDILREVFRGWPEAKVEFRLTGRYGLRDYCVQYGESDLDFVQRLMEDEGIFYFFEHEDGAHTLVIADANDAMKPAPGQQDLPYEPDSRISFRAGDFITHWAPKASVRPGRYASTDYDFTRPALDLAAAVADPRGHGADGAEAYAYPGRYVKLDEGQAIVERRLEELQADHRRVAARGTARHLWPGRSFTLSLFPREAENAAHFVIAARYELWDEEVRAGQVHAGQVRPGQAHAGQVDAGQVDAGPDREPTGYAVTLELAPATQPFRPARRTPRPRMGGPQTAVVVGPAGAEIFTDAHARVKLQFHWDRQGKRDENTSCFVRVSQAWAGAGWGFIQIPRIGQEVIVDFLEGDPDQPIVTGRVYNAQEPPPYGLPGSATQSGWKSSSTPGGGGWNELRFEDKAGAEEVYFQAQKDHTELIKNDEGRTIGHDFAESVGNDAKQSVGNNRTESVGNDKSVSVGANRKVAIGANDDETVGGNRTLGVTGTEAISIGGKSDETIGASHSQKVATTQTILVGGARSDTVIAAEARNVGGAQTNIIGAARSVKVAGAQSHSVGAADSWTVAAGQTVKIGAEQTVSTGAAQTVEVGAAQTTKIKAGWTVDVGADQMHKVTGAAALTAGKTVLIDAKDQIDLKCGAASISMKKDGTIVIEGKNITVKGSGKIVVDAGGDVQMKGAKILQN